MAFFQAWWDVVHNEIMEAIQYFHEVGMFTKSLIATFLTLIPKKTEVGRLRISGPLV